MVSSSKLPLYKRISLTIGAFGKPFSFALRFFTRIPPIFRTRITSIDITRSSYYFILVGMIEAAFVALALYTGSKFDDGIIAAAFCLAARMAISRGPMRNMAHACDGLFSSRNRVRMVQIMLDDRYGTMAIASLTFDVILKYNLYYELISRLGAINALPMIASSCLAGKLCALTGIAFTGSVFGKDKLIDASHYKALFISAAIAFAVVTLISNWVAGVFMLTVEIPMGIIISGLIAIKIGGLTKQTLGLMHEIGELTFLFIVLVWG